ncbi:CsbD family protein [Novacetimonas cocois]|uniref:CsbD family protein n=2 Tax=Novacetimonas cocois TaxID=1747507 RepID=A0A365YSG9_9PROT|nr:CsbD family protein [Novacetimonas cocois]
MDEDNCMTTFKNIISSTANIIAGQLKQEIGYVTGSRKITRSGVAQEMKGHAQKVASSRPTDY